MALVTVDTPLALLQVDWIMWQVPVVVSMAVGMEIEALLPDRRGRQDEGSER